MFLRAPLRIIRNSKTALVAASADSDKKLLAVGEIGGEVTLLAMEKAPGTKNTNGVVTTESKLKLADESVELEKVENKTQSTGKTDYARSSDYGNDLNVEKRKTFGRTGCDHKRF